MPRKISGPASSSTRASSTIDILQQIVQGGLVMNQRIDKYRFISDSAVINLPVMGVFMVSGGLITSWADYFDLGQSGLAQQLIHLPKQPGHPWVSRLFCALVMAVFG
jgi:limonene-1,2-epoxide hydrolase